MASIYDVYDVILELHNKGAYHIKRGFKLNEVTPAVQSNHFIEECVELQAEILCNNKHNMAKEAGHALAAFLHIFITNNLNFDSVCSQTIEMLYKHFTLDPQQITASTPGFNRSNRIDTEGGSSDPSINNPSINNPSINNPSNNSCWKNRLKTYTGLDIEFTFKEREVVIPDRYTIYSDCVLISPFCSLSKQQQLEEIIFEEETITLLHDTVMYRYYIKTKNFTTTKQPTPFDKIFGNNKNQVPRFIWKDIESFGTDQICFKDCVLEEQFDDFNIGENFESICYSEQTLFFGKLKFQFDGEKWKRVVEEPVFNGLVNSISQ